MNNLKNLKRISDELPLFHSPTANLFIGQRRPTFPFPGAKGRLAPALARLMPLRGRTYFEPCVGRGNMFFTAATRLRYQNWWINDTSTSPFFMALKSTMGRIDVPKRTRYNFRKYRRRFKIGDKSAILLEPYFTFSGGGYFSGGFGGKRSAKAHGYSISMINAAHILNDTAAKITSDDCFSFKWDTLGPEDFVFIDPPYLDADVRAYSNSFDHIAMVRRLRNARFRWMLTEYYRPLYVEALGEPCWTQEMQLACDGRGHRKRKECVWKNY